ncbi:MAG TPA: hypothetical protein VIU64_17495 [Polyangia bacterium]
MSIDRHKRVHEIVTSFFSGEHESVTSPVDRPEDDGVYTVTATAPEFPRALSLARSAAATIQADGFAIRGVALEQEQDGPHVGLTFRVYVGGTRAL